LNRRTAIVTNRSVEHIGRISRRRLLAGGGGLLGVLAPNRAAVLRAQETADAAFPRLKVVDIEEHKIMAPYRDWAHYEMMHFHGPTKRVIYVVRTNSGLIGLGENEEPLPKDVLEKYIGTSPFDWFAGETSKALGTAMYDLMGKAAGIPAYKLIGPKYRSWVPAAAWTVSTHPQRMANTVKQLASLGYTWMKYHLSPFENVIDRMEAMQAVAPKGFRIHHDFTMGGAGGYIPGNSTIGSVIRHAGLFAMHEVPFSWRNTGGTIMRAITVHLQAARKNAYPHFNNDTETWKAGVVKERLKKPRLPAQPDWIIKTRFANGSTMYNLANTKTPIFMVRPDARRLVTLSCDAPVTTA
jgi:hypothetical protein